MENCKLSITLEYNGTVLEPIIKRKGEEKKYSELERSEQLDVLNCLRTTHKTFERFLKKK